MNYDLEKLMENGQINDYFYNKLKKSWLFMNSDLHDDFGEFMNDIMIMSNLGVSSKEDELFFRRIQHDIPDVISEISDESFQITDYYIYELIKEMYHNKDKYDISDLLSVFCSVAKAAQEVGIPLSDKASDSCFIGKTAYPNHQDASHMKQTYNISKWIDATKDIYSRVYRLGMPYVKAFENVTDNWDKMEKLNYKHWLKFYTEGVPAKYPKLAGHGLRKAAQGYISDSGVYIPMAGLIDRQNVEDVPKEKPKPEPDKNEVRDRVESHRSRILSRLSSAEKLLTSLEGQQFAGDEQEFMLKLLQDLKRKVQTAHKISVHSSLFEDFIYRAANYMGNIGSKNGKAFFVKIAQMDPFAGALPPSELVTQESSGDPVEDTRKAFREMKELSENLEESGVLFFDQDDDSDERVKIKKEKEAKESASQQVPAPSPIMPEVPKTASIFDDIVVVAQYIPNLDEDISIGEAEVAPPQDRPSQKRMIPEAASSEVQQNVSPQDITVTEDEVDNVGLEDDTGDIIDEALEHVTVHDAINLLEMLVSIYKQREVPRQLSKLDMVMDHLGLAAYFPQLGEAQTKALDVTQYVSTRLEDMLAKLKGSIESSEANSWVEKKKTIDPATKAVQTDLQIKEEEEKKRKEMRKEKSDEKVMDKGKNDVGQQAEKELSGPTTVETGKPLKVR